MKNTNCSQPSERYRLTPVLGKEVRAKSYRCSSDGVCYHQKPAQMKLWFSICPAAYCPGNCPFCIATGTKERTRIDLAKLERTMRALKEEEVVLGIKITGGEPFYDLPLLKDTLALLFDIFGPELNLSISTNGMGFQHLLELPHVERIEAIHLSRHHYDDERNRALFGFDVPSSQAIREVVAAVAYKDLFVINCLLLKDYIASPEEAHRMLDYAMDLGIPKVGFLECSPVNDYARSQRVCGGDVIRRGDPSLLFTRGFTDYEFCSCQDGVYLAPDGRIMEFYLKQTTSAACDYCRGLVYGPDDHLRTDFGGEILV